MRSALNILIYTYIWVALGAGSLAYISAELQGIPGAAPAALTFLLALSSYSFIRLIKERYSQPNRLGEEDLWNEKHKGLALFTFIASTTATISLVWEFIGTMQLYKTLVLPGILTLAYAYPLGKNNRIRLREVPGLKILTISLSWAWTAFFVPSLLTGGAPALNEYFILVSMTLYTIAITIPFDIRDMRKDDNSMRTLPQVLGSKKAGWLGILLLLLTWLTLFSIHDEKQFITSSGTALSYAAIMIFLAGDDRDEFFYGFWVEASPIIWVFHYWAFVVL
jgi:4-hydroxybenzoate polyprenyltransferase